MGQKRNNDEKVFIARKKWEWEEKKFCFNCETGRNVHLMD